MSHALLSGIAPMRRRIALGLTAGASVGAFLLGAGPVNAVTPPDWPTAGRLPLGCDPGVIYTNTTATTWTYEFTDSSVPTISGPRVSTGAGTVGVLAPGGSNVYAYASISDSCSGVGGAIVDYARNGSMVSGSFLAPASTDSFAGTWSAFLGKWTPDKAGVYTVPVAAVVRRYDSITLDQNFRLVSKVNASGIVTVVGPWATAKSYLLRQTTLSIVAPTSVKRGKQATISGVLKYAINTGLVADNGEKVAVQTRVGTGAWKTVATVTANTAGAFSAKVTLSKTTQVRLVHNAVLSGRYTAAATSATKTVKTT
jgi:hypothetical protein